jgi:hypothetical protein
MLDKTGMGRNELLEGCIDLEEVDIGDKTIDAGIDAGGPGPVQVATGRDEVS